MLRVDERALHPSVSYVFLRPGRYKSDLVKVEGSRAISRGISDIEPGNWFSFGIGGSSIYFWNLDMSFNLEMQKQRMLTGRFLFSEEIDLTLSGGSSDYETTDYARDFELLYGRFLYTKHTHLSYSIGLSYFINSIYNSIDGFDHHGTIGLPVQVQGYITSVSWLNKNSRGGMGLSLFANLNLEESFWGILISYYLGNNVQVNGDKPE